MPPVKPNSDLARIAARLSIIESHLRQVQYALTKLQNEADEAKLHRIMSNKPKE